MKLTNTRFTFTTLLLLLLLHFSGFSQSKKQQELEERRRELRQENGADRRHVLRWRDQEVCFLHAQLHTARQARHADALLCQCGRCRR